MTVSEKDQGDELSFDFGKLFKRFRKEKPHQAHPHAEKSATHPEGEDKSSIDFAAVGDLLKRYYPLLLILIPFFLAGHLRVTWLDLPQIDGWAENSVDGYYRGQIGNQIASQYPNLPPQNREALITREFEKLKRENNEMRKQQTANTAQQFKDHFREDATGATYIGDIDTYYFLKRTENLVKYGSIGNIQKEGKSYDTYTLAPVGEFTDNSMIYYAVGWTYKILHVLSSGVTLRFAFVYVPVLLAMLSIIPAFFLARRIGGNFGGFFAAMLVAVHSNYLTRTMGGATDTDVYNVFFPLVIFWLFVEGIESARASVQYGCIALAGILVGLYSFAWGGWWYIFDFICITMLASIAYYALLAWRTGKLGELSRNQKVRTLVAVFGAFFIISTISVTLFSSWNVFVEAPFSPLKIFTLKQASQESLWPNVYTTVAELNEAGIGSVLNSLGGKFMVLLSLIGLVFAVARKGGANWPLIAGSIGYYLVLLSLQDKISAMLFTALLGIPIGAGILLSLYHRMEIDAKLALVFAMWYIGMIFSSTKGIRFTMLTVPPFAIGLGIFAGYVAEHLGSWLHQELKVGKLLSKGILVVLLCIILIAPVRGGFQTAKTGIPLINDAWWHVLEKIKAVTPPHTIITSWWDYGHWFKAVADRPVTFDGANQNNPQAHWVGKFFLTWDERQALGMLRMLDCSGMEASNVLNTYTDDTYRTVKILNAIIPLSLPKARAYLEEEVGAAAVEVLPYTHCRPPPAVVIASEDMVGKSGVWAHFGSWDFAKAKAWITARGKGKAEAVPLLITALGITDIEAGKLYDELAALPDEGAANRWIAPWPSYSSGSYACQKKDNMTILCPVSVQGKQLPLQVDLRTFSADLIGTDVTYHPDTVTYRDGENFNVRVYNNNTLGISLMLIRDGENFQAVYIDPALAGSLYTRLFYFDGKGTKYFAPITHERDLTGLDIIAYAVDWDSYLQDIEGADAALPDSPFKGNYPSWT